MATYYIDQFNGNDTLDGLAPETARKNYTDIDVQAGDLVLFKRGSFYRDKLYVLRCIKLISVKASALEKHKVSCLHVDVCIILSRRFGC